MSVPFGMPPPLSILNAMPFPGVEADMVKSQSLPLSGCDILYSFCWELAVKLSPQISTENQINACTVDSEQWIVEFVNRVPEIVY